MSLSSFVPLFPRSWALVQAPRISLSQFWHGPQHSFDSGSRGPAPLDLGSSALELEAVEAVEMVVVEVVQAAVVGDGTLVVELVVVVPVAVVVALRVLRRHRRRRLPRHRSRPNPTNLDPVPAGIR